MDGESVTSSPSPSWQHPWLRIQLLLRSMLGTRWNAA
jgi:hypothetical protein